MANYVEKIRTSAGDKQINYEALANKPVERIDISMEDVGTWSELNSYTETKILRFTDDLGQQGYVIVIKSDHTSPEAISQYILYNGQITIRSFMHESGASEIVEDSLTTDKVAMASQIGDISTALDELHNYAQALISGGES